MNLNILQKEYDSLCLSVIDYLYTRLSKYFAKSVENKLPRAFELLVRIDTLGIHMHKLDCSRVNNASVYKKFFKIVPYKFKSLEDLTISLPKYGKALEQFLETNVFIIDGRELSVLDIYERRGVVPYWQLLILAMGIDPVASYVADEYKSLHISPELQALYIKIYRQLTLYGYKIEMEFADAALLQKQYQFMQNDTHKAALYPQLEKPFRFEISEFIRHFLKDLSKSIKCNYAFVYDENYVSVEQSNFNFSLIKAKHSQGAISNVKSNIRTGARRMYKPSIGVQKISGLLDYIHHRKVGDELPSKIAFVPKDSRGPRMIAMEPDYMGAPQSLVQEALYDQLKKYGIDLTNQDNNRFYALLSSATQDLSTIDLRNASDNILTEHIRDLFPDEWRDLLLSLRSNEVELSDGYRYKLYCFATMGNKLTFPIQTLIFLAITSIATYKALKKRPKLKEKHESVLVYGDDIIVPTAAFDFVTTVLANWGFDVNISKSFSKGFFRESCGIFAYKGYNVNCVYRRNIELKVEHVNELLANNLWISNEFIRFPMTEGCVNAPIDYTSIKKLIDNKLIRWNDNLQRIEVKLQVHRTFFEHYQVPDDRPFLDEWLRLYSHDTNPISVPRVVPRNTEKDILKLEYIPLDISIPEVINVASVVKQLLKVATEPYRNIDGLKAVEPVIYGDIDVLTSEFVPSESTDDNFKKGKLTMKNYNYEFLSGLSALNKKVDAIKASFKAKAEAEKKLIPSKPKKEAKKADSNSNARIDGKGGANAKGKK